MELRDSYTIVVTDRLEATRSFWVELFGFEPAFETSWFCYLVNAQGARAALGLMRAGLEFQHPAHRAPYAGQAMILTMEVADAAAERERLRQLGADVEVELRDEPWGQRHFMLRDPAGVWVDVVEQTEPDPAFLSESERGDLAALADDG